MTTRCSLDTAPGEHHHQEHRLCNVSTKWLSFFRTKGPARRPHCVYGCLMDRKIQTLFFCQISSDQLLLYPLLNDGSERMWVSSKKYWSYLLFRPPKTVRNSLVYVRLFDDFQFLLVPVETFFDEELLSCVSL